MRECCLSILRVVRMTYDFQRGRKLTWLSNYSKAELRIGYLDKPYIVTCNYYKILVLLQFNDLVRRSLDDLVAATGLEKGVLVQVLENFCQADFEVRHSRRDRHIQT